MKKCTCCSETKLLTEFHKTNRARGERAARGGFGVQAECKSCRAEKRKPGITAQRECAETLAAAGVKRCTKCKAVKQTAEFHKRKGSPDGLAYKCIACANAANAAWRESNPDGWKRWLAANEEHRENYVRRWVSEDRGLRAALFKRWAQANRDKRRATLAKRKAAQISATPKWANEDAIRKIYAEAVRLTKETGVRYEVDHIVPLQGRIVTGLHWEGNLQVLQKFENQSKLNRRWPDIP